MASEPTRSSIKVEFGDQVIKMRAFQSILFIAVIFVLLSCHCEAQPALPNGRDREEQEPVEPGSKELERRETQTCDSEFRTLDGTCTSIGSPPRQAWGSSNRPQFTYFTGRGNAYPKGMDLPSPRMISNTLCKQKFNRFDKRGLSELATFVGQFIDHTIVASVENLKDPLFITVPDDDLLHEETRGKMKFFRSRRVRVKESDNQEIPQNILPSVLDLSSVYGPSKMGSSALRTKSNGLMKTSGKDLLPTNAGKLSNLPSNDSTRFFIAGDHRANEHPVLTSLHTIFLREHNNIARELKGAFPAWKDQRLFENARKINGAQFQKIVFKEWYPSITRRHLATYKGFNKNADPTISLLFSTVATFRVGHTM